MGPDPTGTAVRLAAQRAGERRSGVVVGVLEPDGRRVYGSGGRLSAPGEHDLFEIGSISKVFTALVLAIEVTRGTLRLDQPVRELLGPGIVLPTYRGTEITLGTLASHTSGLPRSPSGAAGMWWAFVRGRNPYAGFTEEVLLEGVTCTRLRRRPGTGRLRYSNLGYALLGVALVRATGAAGYHEMVTERISAPLGLRNTGVRVDGRVLPGHRGRDHRAERWLLEGMAGAGALVSTADDLLTFLAAQLNPGGTPLGDALRLRLGWMTQPRPRLLVWHNGGTGGFRSFAGYQPGLGRGVVVLANHNRGVDLTALRLLRELDSVNAGCTGT